MKGRKGKPQPRYVTTYRVSMQQNSHNTIFYARGFGPETGKAIIQGGARNVIPLIVHVTHFYYYKKHLTSGTELILTGWKIVPNEEHVQCDHRFAS